MLDGELLQPIGAVASVGLVGIVLVVPTPRSTGSLPGMRRVTPIVAGSGVVGDRAGRQASR